MSFLFFVFLVIVGSLCGGVIATIVCRILYYIPNQKTEDMMRCFKMLFATLFLGGAGFILFYPELIFERLMHPGVLEILPKYVNTLITILPYVFFLAAVICLIFTIKLFVYYFQEYR